MPRIKTQATRKTDNPSTRDILKALKKRQINEGRMVNAHQLDSFQTQAIFTRLRWTTFLQLPNIIYPTRIYEFFASFTYDEEEELMTFTIGGKDFGFSLEQLGRILNIPSSGLKFYHDSHNLAQLPPAFTMSEIIGSICKPNVPHTKTNLLGKDLLDECAVWNKVIDSNIFPKSGHHSEISVCQAVLLHALKTGTEVNLMHILAKRMSGLPNSRRDLPYGRLLSTLFTNLPGIPTVAPTSATSAPIDLATLRKMSSHKGKKRAHSSSGDTEAEIEAFTFGDTEHDEGESSIPLDDGMVEGTLDERVMALNRNVNRLREEHRSFKKEVKSMFKALLNAIKCQSGAPPVE